MKPVTLDFSDTKAVEALFNEAFQHPRRTYIVHPVNVAVAQAWLQTYNTMRASTWVGEGEPLRYDQLIHLDELYDQDRCGYAASAYHCNYPDTASGMICDDDECDVCSGENEDEENEKQKPQERHHKRKCFSFNCPIAYEADRNDIKQRDPDLYKSDYQPYPSTQPEEWMILYSRPRYAFVPNVQVVGCR